MTLTKLRELLLKFKKLKDCTLEVFSNQYSDYNNTLISYLQIYSSSHPNWNEMLNAAISHSSSSPKELWDRCMLYCHLLNFDLLEYLIIKCRDRELQHKLEDFKKHWKILAASTSPTKVLLAEIFPTKNSAAPKGDLKIKFGIEMNSWDDIYNLCHYQSNQLNLSFLQTPCMFYDGQFLELTWSAPKIAHTDILEWRLQLNLRRTSFKKVIVNDEEYWSKLSLSHNSSASPLNSNTLLQILMSANSANTLTHQCLAHICNSITGTPFTPHNLPEDLYLTLSYVAMLAHEQSILQDYTTTTDLVSLPIAYKGLGYVNIIQGNVDLHPLLHQFLIAFYQSSPFCTSVRRFSTGYMPYFSTGIQHSPFCTSIQRFNSRYIPHSSAGIQRNRSEATNHYLCLFETQVSHTIENYFRRQQEIEKKEFSHKTSDAIFQDLKEILGGNEARLAVMFPRDRDQRAYYKTLREFSLYITGVLMYHSNSKWEIDCISKPLLHGILAAAKVVGVSPSYDRFRIDVQVSNETELHYFSRFPIQILSKAHQVHITGVRTTDISLAAMNTLATLSQLRGVSIQLTLQDTYITEFCWSTKMQGAIHHFLFLSLLYICDCTLTSEVVEGVSYLLTRSNVLRQFKYCRNNTADSDTKLILRGIGANQSLRAVQYEQTLTVENSQLLFSSLQNGNSHVRLLIMSNCSITLHHSRELQFYLGSSRFLHQLELYRNSIDINCMELLVEGLYRNNTLKVLNIGFNPIGDEGFELLSGALCDNQRLEVLRADKINVGSKGVTHLAMVLLENENNCLKKLDLSCNLIADDGVQQMATLLCNNPPLEDLNLRSNSITSLGAQFLAAALDPFYNKKLRKLNLDANLLDNSGHEALEEVKGRNPLLSVTASVDKFSCPLT